MPSYFSPEEYNQLLSGSGPATQASPTQAPIGSQLGRTVSREEYDKLKAGQVTAKPSTDVAATPRPNEVGWLAPLTESLKGLARGTVDVAKSVTGAIPEMAGGYYAAQADVLRQSPAAMGPGAMPPANFDYKAAQTAVQQAPTPNPMAGQAAAAEQFFAPYANAPSIQANPTVASTEYLGNAPLWTKATKLASDVGQGAPSVAAAIGGAMVGGPAGAGVMGGALTASPWFEKARKEGLDEKNALAGAAVIGGGSAILNSIPFLEKLPDMVPAAVKGRIATFIAKGLAEAGTETAEGGLNPFAEVASGQRKLGTIRDFETLLVDAGKGAYAESGTIPASFLLGGMIPGGANREQGPTPNVPAKVELAAEASKIYEDLKKSTDPRGPQPIEPDSTDALYEEIAKSFETPEQPATTPQEAPVVQEADALTPEDLRAIQNNNQNELRGLRGKYGADTVSVLVAQSRYGDPIDLAKAKEDGAARAAERAKERERAFSPEGKAESDAKELARVEADTKLKNEKFSELGGDSIEPGIYYDDAAEAQYEVIKSKNGDLFIMHGRPGDMRPLGSVRSGNADSQAIYFALQIKDGSAVRTQEAPTLPASPSQSAVEPQTQPEPIPVAPERGQGPVERPAEVGVPISPSRASVRPQDRPYPGERPTTTTGAPQFRGAIRRRGGETVAAEATPVQEPQSRSVALPSQEPVMEAQSAPFDLTTMPMEQIDAFMADEDARMDAKEQEVAKKYLTPEQQKIFNSIPNTEYGYRRKAKMFSNISDEAFDAFDNTAMADSPETASRYRQVETLREKLDKFTAGGTIEDETEANKDLELFLRDANFDDPVDVRVLQELTQRYDAAGLDVNKMLRTARAAYGTWFYAQTKDVNDALDMVAYLDAKLGIPAQAEEPSSKPSAEFVGLQERPRGQEPIGLYNIPTPDGGKTTVTAETAKSHGFSVPEPLAFKAEPAKTEPAKQPWEMTREEYDSEKPPLKPRQSIVLDNYGKKTEVVQNPTNEDIARLSDAVRKKFPDMPKGEVKLRQTRDEDGNEYVWQAHEGMHGTIEPMLQDIVDSALNQNAQKKPHRNTVYDALLNGKEIPPEVLAQYPEVVDAYNSTKGKQKRPVYVAKPDFMGRQGDTEQYSVSLYRDGKLVGDGTYTVSADGTARIGKIHSFKGANSIGADGILSMRKDLMRQNPKIKKFVGDRVTGATAKTEQPAPEATPESQKAVLQQKLAERKAEMDTRNAVTYSPETQVVDAPKPAAPPKSLHELKKAKDRVDKHGLTKDQMDYLTGEIQARWSELPNKKSEYEGVPNVATIKVPGDGTFVIGTQEAANAIHKRLTGKWIDESMAYDSKKSGGSSPVDPRTTPDYMKGGYGGDVAGAAKRLKAEDEALRLLNEAKTPNEVAYARIQYDRAMGKKEATQPATTSPMKETEPVSEETAKGNKFFWYGNEAKYTGKTTDVNGETFYEFEYLEGADKGKKGVRLAPDDPSASRSESNKPTGRPTPQVPAEEKSAPKTTASEKQPYEMTSEEYFQSELEKNRYKSKYEQDPKAMANLRNIKEQEWLDMLYAQAEVDTLPLNVIDDYVSKFGEGELKRRFRGRLEKGIAGWMPTDVRREGTNRETFYGFTDGEKPLKAGMIAKALNREQQFAEGKMTIRQWIDKKYTAGELYAASEVKNKMTDTEREWLAKHRETFKNSPNKELEAKAKKEKTVYTINGIDLGKVAYDYAKYRLDTEASMLESRTTEQQFNPEQAKAPEIVVNTESDRFRQEELGKVLPNFERMVKREASPQNMLIVAEQFMDGEAPYIKEAIASRLWEISPEAAALGSELKYGKGDVFKSTQPESSMQDVTSQPSSVGDIMKGMGLTEEKAKAKTAKAKAPSKWLGGLDVPAEPAAMPESSAKPQKKLMSPEETREAILKDREEKRKAIEERLKKESEFDPALKGTASERLAGKDVDTSKDYPEDFLLDRVRTAKKYTPEQLEDQWGITKEEATMIDALINATGIDKNMIYVSSHGRWDAGGAMDTQLVGVKKLRAFILSGAKSTEVRGNPAMPLHEVGHVFRNILFDEQLPQSKRGNVTLEDIEVAKKWAGVTEVEKGGGWNREAEEKFTLGLSKYIETGEAPTPALKRIFQKVKNWMDELFIRLISPEYRDWYKGIEITPEIKDVFDRMFGKKPAEAPQQSQSAPATGSTTTASVPKKTTVKRILESVPSNIVSYDPSTNTISFDPSDEGITKVRDAVDKALDSLDVKPALQAKYEEAHGDIMDAVFSKQEEAPNPTKGKKRSDETGAVNIGLAKDAAKKVLEIVKKAASTKSIEFSHGLGKDTKNANVVRVGTIARLVSEGEQAVIDFNEGYRTFINEGKGRAKSAANRFKEAPEDMREMLNKFLIEQDPEVKQARLEALPEPMRESAERMRTTVDALSRQLRNEGVASKATAEKIENQEGYYLRRTFKIFKDPDWKNQISEKMKDAVRKHIAKEEELDPSSTEVTRILNGYMNIADNTEPSIVRRGKKLGTKDLSTLQKRGEFDQSILDLWGVEKDGIVNFLETLTAQANLIANHRFLRAVARIGEGKTVFSADLIKAHTEVDTDPSHPDFNDEYDRLIRENRLVPFEEGAAKKDRFNPSEIGRYGAMAGSMVERDFKEAMQEAVAHHEITGMLGELAFLNSVTKAGMTALSPKTASLNFWSNSFIAAQAHHLFYGSPKAIANRMRLAMKVARIETSTRHDKGIRTLGNKLIGLGVLKDTIGTTELQKQRAETKKTRLASLMKKAPEMADSAIEKVYGADPHIFKSISNALGMGVEQAFALYQAGDDVWKTFGWLAERDMLKEAYPNWSERQLDVESALRVRRFYTTYSELPNAVKVLRHNPLIAPFVAFYAEVPRGMANTMLQAKQDIVEGQRTGNTVLRNQGLKRAGSMMVAAATLEGISQYYKMKNDVDDDDEETLRMAQPSWDKAGTFGWYDIDRVTGKAKAYNLSAMVPQAIAFDPLTAFFRAETIGQGVHDFAKELASPLYQPEIGFMALRNQWYGIDSDNKPIFTESDPMGEQWYKRGAQFWKDMSPGAYKSVVNVSKAEDKVGKAFDELSGQRTVDVDLPKSLFYKAIALQKAGQEQNRDIGKAVKAEDREAIMEQYKQRVEAHKLAWREASDMIKGMKRFGVDDMLIVKSLKEAGLDTPRDRNRLINGNYVEPKMPDWVKKALAD